MQCFKSLRRKDGMPPKSGSDGTGGGRLQGREAQQQDARVEHRSAGKAHTLRIDGRSAPGLDARTTRHESYAISQRNRKRNEGVFGWMKAVGGLRKSRFVGMAKTQLAAYMVGAALDLPRYSGLAFGRRRSRLLAGA